VGGSIFSLRTRIIHVTQRAAPIRMPGKMPARNSLEMETLPATPKMTNPMLGGMTGPMTPQAAISPPERALSCPARVIMGSSNAVNAAASATADPDRADRRQAATMAT
jgi:hypothetical protein